MRGKFFEIKYLKRLIVIGVTVGIIAGFGAILFYETLEICTNLFLVNIASYNPPKPSSIGWKPPDNPYLIILSLTIGGILSGLIVYTFAPEAEGHGTDAAIRAFHREGGKVRARVPIIKTIASAITIGSGGSAGREGPTAQISAGLGSIVATLLKLSPKERRLAVAVGIGAGIGSIFKAPLGGAILGAEILYKEDVESEVIVPSLIASTIGYIIFCSFEGYQPIFSLPEKVAFYPIHIPFFIILGFICGIVGLLYIFTFYGMHNLFSKLFKRSNLPLHLKPLIGAFIAGLIVVFFMSLDERIGLGSIGMGYGFLQLAMYNLLPWEIMLMIAFVKIITTSLTIGSGGSGGVFAPGLVIGGMIGGALGSIFHQTFPSIISPELIPMFVAVGMISLFGGVSKAPIANMIMVSEMTNNYMILFPSMAAVFVSYVVTGKYTIYVEQVDTRIDSPAHRMEMAIDILEDVPVKVAMTSNVRTVSPDDTLLDVMDLIEKEGHIGYPVAKNDKLVGIITLSDVEKVPIEERESTRVVDVMTPNPIVTHPDESLRKALEKMVLNDVGRLPVIKDGNLVGIITKGDIVRAYARLRKIFQP